MSKALPAILILGVVVLLVALPRGRDEGEPESSSAPEQSDAVTSSSGEPAAPSRKSEPQRDTSPQSPWSIRGQVLLPDGNPATEGTVTAWRSSPDFRWEVELGDEGRFEVPWRHCDYSLKARVPGFPPAVVDGESMTRDGVDVVITVQPGVEIFGSVVDPDGRPLSGARVEVEIRPFHHGRPHVETGDDGRFRFAALPGRHFALFVSHPTHVGEVLRDPLPSEPTTVFLEPGCVLIARMPQPLESGFPILNTEGRKNLPWERSGNDPLRYRTEPFHPSVPRGVVEVPGYRPIGVEFPAESGVHDLGELRPKVGWRLKLRTIDTSGDPIADANVAYRFASEPFHITDANGECTITGLTTEELWLDVEKEGHVKVSPDVAIERDGQERVLVLKRLAHVSVRLVTPRGAPAVTAFALIEDFVSDGPGPHAAGGPSQSRRVDLDGRATLAMHPDREYRLVTLHQGFQRVGPHVTLGEGEHRDLGDFVVAEADSSISGVIHTSDGRLVPGYAVQIRPSNVVVNPGAHSLSPSPIDCITDGAGWFSVSVPSGGHYVVEGFKEGHTSFYEYLEELPPGGKQLDIEVHPLTSTRRRGRVVDDTGAAVRRANVQLRTTATLTSDRTNDDGEYELDYISQWAAGAVRLTVTRGMQSATVFAPSLDELPDPVVLPRGADLVVFGDLDLAPGERSTARLVVRRAADGREVNTAHIKLRRDFHWIDAEPGSYLITLSGRSFTTRSDIPCLLERGRETKVRVALKRKPPPVEARLTVVDHEGTALEGAEVFFRTGGGRQELVTADDGTCVVELRPEDPASLYVRHTGFAPFDGKWTLSDSPTITLEPESVVTVIAQGDAPDETSVWLNGKLSELRDGRVTWRQLHAGDYEVALELEDDWRVTETFSLGTGEAVAVELEVPDGFEIQGRLSRGGRTAGSGTVHIGRGSYGLASLERKVSGGRFSVRLRESGWYFFDFFPDSGDRFMCAEYVSGAGKLNLDLPTRLVTLKFLDPGGAPLRGRKVWVSGEHDPMLDAQGSVTLELSPGWHSYSHRDNATGWSNGGWFHLDAESEITLRLETRRWLAVRIDSPEPAPRWVTWLDGGGKPWRRLEALEGSSGHLLFTAETGILRMHDDSGWVASAAVGADTREVVMEAKRGGELRVGVDEFVLGDVRGATVTAIPIDGDEPPLSRVFERLPFDEHVRLFLPEGRYRMRLTLASGQSWELPAECIGGERTSVTFR